MTDRAKWEYRTVVATTAAQLGGLLPHHGWNGWELVSVIENESGNLVAFLKRPASRGLVDFMGSRASVWEDESL
ncbi:MAG TPA: hypothetical protein VGH74_10290 [Planctomycetaceae bacterium]|jgi:hypothetical protein